VIRLGVPVVDQYELTKDCISTALDNAVYPESLDLIVIDNGSQHPYTDTAIPAKVIRLPENQGYYLPILLMAELSTDADLIGLMHNDHFIFEKGWDKRVIEAFVHNVDLGMVGTCGSDEVDDRGGRGGGTMCNFPDSSDRFQLQIHTGKKVTGLHPALIFDSMFMVMRRPVVADLVVDIRTAPCHFYDKIWSMRSIHSGWENAVLGLEVGHMGGKTAVEMNAIEEVAERWCQQEGISYEANKAGLALYLEAERRWLEEGRRTGFVPSKI
jgi:hypothetical protein